MKSRAHPLTGDQRKCIYGGRGEIKALTYWCRETGGFGYEDGRWFSPYCFFSFFFLCQLSDKVHQLRGRRQRQRKEKIGDSLWVSESESAREIGIVGLSRSGEGPLEPRKVLYFSLAPVHCWAHVWKTWWGEVRQRWDFPGEYMKREVSLGVEGEHEGVIIVKTRVLSWRKREPRPQRRWQAIQTWKVNGLENWERYFDMLRFQMWF